MYCLACHYPLHNLPAPTCPECGRAFDPADPETFATRSAAQVRRSALSRAQLAIVMYPVFWLVTLHAAQFVSVAAGGPRLAVLADTGPTILLPLLVVSVGGLFLAFPLSMFLLVPLADAAAPVRAMKWWLRRLALTLAAWAATLALAPWGWAGCC